MDGMLPKLERPEPVPSSSWTVQRLTKHRRVLMLSFGVDLLKRIQSFIVLL
jgi:hypothetical protein